jgi:hypothetical protein
MVENHLNMHPYDTLLAKLKLFNYVQVEES